MIPSECSNYCNRFTSMSTGFESIWDDPLGLNKSVQHHIKLNKRDSQPIQRASFKPGLEVRKFEKEEIDQMPPMDVTEPAQKKWASMIVFVPEKEGAPCFCFDFCRLNAVTIRDLCPIPWVYKFIYLLDDAMIFTALNANSRYSQVEVSQDEPDKIAFTSHIGLLRFTRKPWDWKTPQGRFNEPWTSYLQQSSGSLPSFI